MNLESSAMCEELWAALNFNRKVISPLDQINALYEGAHFGPGARKTDEVYDLENHVFEYAALMLPMAFDVPRIAVGTNHGGIAQEIASGLRHAGNQWLRQANCRRRIIKAALDFIMLYGVVMTTLEPQPGFEHEYADGKEDVPLWPKWTRLPQSWHFWDPKAMEWEDAVFEGHKVFARQDELLELAENHPEEGWILDAVKAACEDDKVGELDLPTTDTPERREFVYYEKWYPGVQIDPKRGPRQGYNGTIYTLCMGIEQVSGGTGKVGKAYQIREPRPFFGPRWGPYTKMGAYPAHNQAVPMSPVQAVMTQVKELNDQVRAANKSAREYKRLILVDSANNKLVQDLVSQASGFVIPVEGLQKDQVVEIEVNGVSDQQLRLIELARSRLDRVSAMSDAVRGDAEAGVTATADAIAAQSSQSRVGFIRREFVEGVTQMIRTACWYMFAEERFKITLSEEAAAELIGSPAVVEYVGGEMGSGDGDNVIDPGWFDRMDFEIQPYSMDRTDEASQQRNSMLAFNLVTSAMPYIRAFPEADWKRILAQLGDGINVPGFGDLVDLELAHQIGMMQGLLAPQQQGGGEGQGNAGRAIGSAALFGPSGRRDIGPGSGAGGGMGPRRPVEGSNTGGAATATMR